MATTVQEVEAPGDAELISAVRGGDVDAYGQLFERHVEAARRLARQLVSAGDVEDLVSDAFVKVLGVLQRGGGPDVAFRAYLLTAVRRLRVDRLRAGSKLQTSDDMEKFDPGVPFRDTAVEGFESEAAAKAFASLPERWQLVLWHTEVEGQKPAEVAPLLGMTPNSVSALAYRAREGLRQAFLNQHAQEMDEDTCRWTHEHLGGYVRNGLSRRDTVKVETHLQDCRRCAAIYLELTEVNDNLAGILAPLLLGGVATAYVATTGGAAASGGLVALLDRAKDTLTNPAGAVVGGVAATVVVAAGVFALTTGDEPASPPPATAEATPGSAGPATEPQSRPKSGPQDDPQDDPQSDPGPRQRTEPGQDAPPADSAPPAPAPVLTPTPAPTPPPPPVEESPDPVDQAPPAEEPPADDPAPGGGLGTADEPGGGARLDEDAPAPPTEEPPVTPEDLRFGRVTYVEGTPSQGVLTVQIQGVTEEATLTVNSSGIVFLGTDSDCPSLVVNSTFTCRVPSDSTLTFRVVAPLGGFMTFDLTSPASDTNLENNHAEVSIGDDG